MTDSLLHIQSKQLAELRSLISETTLEEGELLARVKSNTETAKKTIESALIDLKLKCVEERELAQQTTDTTLAQIKERSELEPVMLQEKHEQRVIELHSSAEDITDQTSSKLYDAVWLAESVYEGAMLKPRKQAQAAIDALEETKETLDTLCEEAPKVLSRLRQNTQAVESNHENEASKSMSAYVSSAQIALEAIQSDPKAKWFVGFRPAIIIFLFTAGGVAGAGTYTGWEVNLSLFAIPIGALILSSLALLVTFASGKNSIRKINIEFAKNVALAKLAYEKSIRAIDNERQEKELAITTNRDVEINKAESRYMPRLNEVTRLLENDLQKEVDRFANVAKKLETKIEQDTIDASSQFDKTMADIELSEQEEEKQIQNTYDSAIASIEEDQTTTMQRLSDRWGNTLSTFSTESENQSNTNALNHPSWKSDWSEWKPNAVSCNTISLGTFDVPFSDIAGELPSSKELQLTLEPIVTLPLCASLPNNTSMLISSSGKQRQKCISMLQNAMMRVLTAITPGKVKFTLIDPVGLGQTFANVLHLADYEESQLLDRAWTEPKHIETQLARLTEHMETVIQKYLRNDFESIDAYNEQAGEIAEPYRFLVIADLPTNFSENAAKRLASIITSGARCGVHVIIHRDNSLPLPAGIDEDTLHRIPLRITEKDGSFCIDEDELR
ncbi:MAG: hypothetical protein HOC27_03425, partial [Phycisphaerae bacterium]|nr:hypothetical protein [Phycisphaerae bacterium]